MTTPNALHSKKTPKWGTPQSLIADARQLLGEIHLDPASSPEFNSLVQAMAIYSEFDSGLKPENPWLGNVFLNPPGGLVVEFWDRLSQEFASGNVQRAFWVGFSVEQLCLLADRKSHPMDYSFCVLRKRLAFNTAELEPGGSPSHGNYICALGCDRELFEKLFASKGKVSHGVLA